MHAMVTGVGDVGAVMLGRDASYPALLAFTLAHEIGHIALGHVRAGTALVEVEDPAQAKDHDQEEQEADAYALTVLTGSPRPEITTEFERYNAPTLADAAIKAGPLHRIEPGTLALCVGHLQGNWPVVMAALKIIYPHPVQIWRAVNALAGQEINWEALVDDDQDFVRALLNADDV